MDCIRRINKRTLLLWSLLLSLSLLCAQGAKLHVHDLDNGQLSKAHSTHDTSHHNHDDGIISELNLSSDGALKKIKSNTLAIAFLVFFVTLVTLFSAGQRAQHCRENKPVLHEYYLLSPPLRAPPLY